MHRAKDSLKGYLFQKENIFSREGIDGNVPLVFPLYCSKIVFIGSSFRINTAGDLVLNGMVLGYRSLSV